MDHQICQTRQAPPIPGLLARAGFKLDPASQRILWNAQREERLATEGPYARVRHPQYVGFMLVMVGFLLQWPTLLTLAMFPVLVVVYRQLAIAEEREVTRQFGDQYGDYSRLVPRFISRWRDRATADPRGSAPARGSGPSERRAA